MKRRVLGCLFLAVSLCFGSASWHKVHLNARPAPAAKTSTISAFNTVPGLPDPNAVFAEANEARIQNGLPAVVRSEKLAAIALERAQDMSSRNYYAHKNPSGLYFYDLFGQHSYHAGFSCENLDLEFTTTPSLYVNAWLGSSQGHRECLLDPRVSEAGYAAAEVATSTDTNPDVSSYVIVAIYAETAAAN